MTYFVGVHATGNAVLVDGATSGGLVTVDAVITRGRRGLDVAAARGEDVVPVADGAAIVRHQQPALNRISAR